ncbi:DUF3304 domain-containing protein [Glaciimonas soli]|uniref:DUF3304 domain-containing protein n=1 Tax=Glaciimonas soli TaxID=2590999 RepID=A0A843YSL4_9BURK|nr:DUF3304 domain-containing protein [Glaciimonas soli]MQR00242.1 DUF3304 domain-containing protein [Glaciimonas soli]
MLQAQMIFHRTFNEGRSMRIKYSLLLAAALALSACSTQKNTEDLSKYTAMKVVNVPMAYVSLNCFAHKGVGYIYSYSVQEPFSKRMANGLDCGGTVAAGYMLPKQWQPGMKVKVRWKPNGRDWIEKTTTIRKYAEAGTLYVHFFQNDEVRVVSSPLYGSESPLHPILKDVVIAPPEEE